MNLFPNQGLRVSHITRALQNLAQYVERSSAPPLVVREHPELDEAAGTWKESSNKAAGVNPFNDGTQAHARFYTGTVRDWEYGNLDRNTLRARALNQKTYRAYLLAQIGILSGQPWSSE